MIGQQRVEVDQDVTFQVARSFVQGGLALPLRCGDRDRGERSILATAAGLGLSEPQLVTCRTPDDDGDQGSGCFHFPKPITLQKRAYSLAIRRPTTFWNAALRCSSSHR